MNVKAINLHLNYGRDEVLHDMNFEINEPKIYGLLGRNGAGKTSLLSLIGSFREPTSGKLLVNDEVPFENENVMQEVTLMYNKDFAGESYPPSSIVKDINRYRLNFDLEYAQQLLKKFKLEGNKAVSKLSKGKQSAFNVVVGLASRSPITIFDEVYLGMDAPARDLFYKELLKDQELHPRIIILSTHLVSEMDYLFDEVIIINEGKILLHESYDDLVSRGLTVIGSKQSVDDFAKGKEVLNEEQLGDTKSVTLYGELSEAERLSASELGLDIGPVSLHDLFIQLTKEVE
ncbi:ATP-binding cassette domain-containing protein [Ornithinibacillus halophilus]|uniref:ABC-2 type transport system ATP-binding protein n=1 Tax=Ornithinibacillus halophilus TaxID=930117 RepID=A0A1M5G4W2_9BACI|nr:ABC transporter ATP-binding protein [Ornithinibacillus halophilus]SHF98472.1 ABC-2 type transport system ATP-binding protein [Ornithinibacillus halophilus]